jgi:hypothetical protein
MIQVDEIARFSDCHPVVVEDQFWAVLTLGAEAKSDTLHRSLLLRAEHRAAFQYGKVKGYAGVALSNT